MNISSVVSFSYIYSEIHIPSVDQGALMLSNSKTCSSKTQLQSSGIGIFPPQQQMTKLFLQCSSFRDASAALEDQGNTRS